MVERIIELANSLKNKTGDANAVREELKSIIIPKVMRILFNSSRTAFAAPVLFFSAFASSTILSTILKVYKVLNLHL